MFCEKPLMRGGALLLSAIMLLGGVLLVRAQQQQGSTVGQEGNRPRRAEDGSTQKSTGPTPEASSRPRAAKESDEVIDDDEIVRVETDLTNVLFTVSDKNRRYVRTLRQEDVRVLEDGVQQEVFTFQRQVDLPLSLAIVIDVSASQQRTLPDEKAAAQAFIDAVVRPNRDEVAVVSFGGEPMLEQGLTGSVARARRAVERIEIERAPGYALSGPIGIGTPPISGPASRAGTTAIWDAVYTTSADELAKSSDKTRRAIILLTDGVDTSSRFKMSEAIEQAIKDDVIVYAIGIGDDFQFEGVDQGSVRKIAERTGGRAYFPRDESDLRTAFEQIQQELREQYLLAYSPKNKKRDGSYRQVRLEIVNPELRKQNLRLIYRQGYFARALGSTAAPPPAKKRS